MIEDYYANKEEEAARQELLSATQVGEAVARGLRTGRTLTVSTAPIKSTVFGGWYDDVRPLLRRRAGLKFQLPDPVKTEVHHFRSVA